MLPDGSGLSHSDRAALGTRAVDRGKKEAARRSIQVANAQQTPEVFFVARLGSFLL